MGVPLWMIPGVGAFLLAGPMFTGATGAIVGGFLGSLGSWGVQQNQLEKYEQAVKNGKTLVVVVAAQPDKVAEAQQILRETDAEEINLHAATSADAPEITE